MTDIEFGRLTDLPWRDAWKHEALDFTPWLAENIEHLSEVIGVPLELTGTEVAVESFSADILARNPMDDTVVLIENQLETTDHSHLGQIITYAAGLEAKTCIWVAAKFHEEHRAAIDWLNEITGDGHQFFALEIELWRIGDSLSAPKFNIVAQPNDWKRDVGRAAKNAQSANLSKTKKLQLEFWTALHERLADHPTIRCQKPQAQHWMTYSIGRSGMHLGTIINTRENRVGVELYLGDANANSYFEQLEEDKTAIHDVLGFELEWMDLPTRRACRLVVFKSMNDFSAESSWPELQTWMISSLEKMRGCFGPRVRELVVGGVQ